MKYLVVVVVSIAFLSLSGLVAAQSVPYTSNPYTGCSGYTTLPGQPCGPSPQSFAQPSYRQPALPWGDQRRLPGAFGRQIPGSTTHDLERRLDAIKREQQERRRALKEFNERLRQQQGQRQAQQRDPARSLLRAAKTRTATDRSHTRGKSPTGRCRRAELSARVREIQSGMLQQVEGVG